jgi:3-deoxy-manno-octulosonate cytidylyltransferase (CMP-KDO synthetase)
MRDRSGGALIFTRAPVPHVRDGTPDDEQIRSGPFLRHLGVYAYRREALLRWVALPPSRLEKLEKLEQLRPLEAGIGIGVAVVEAPEFGGIDTPEDAVRAEAILLSQRPNEA